MRNIVFLLTGVLFCFLFFSGAQNADAVAAEKVSYDDSGTKTLILLRHAKSDKSNMNIPDITRPLEASGKEEAREMGNYLRDQKIKIDVIISSPSVRTKQTLEIICPIIGYAYEKVIWDSSLYACSGDHLISTIRNPTVDYHTMMYVGHNPSMTTAANEFQGQQSIAEVKTCGLVTIDFHTGTWSEAGKLNGTLRFYQKPK